MLIYGKSASMMRSVRRVLLLLLIATELWRPAAAQNEADATCSRYVEYLPINGKFMARIKIPKDDYQYPGATVRVALEKPIDEDFKGHHFIWDEFITDKDWTYGVHFQNFRSKVINIELNRKQICAESEGFIDLETIDSVQYIRTPNCDSIRTNVYVSRNCHNKSIPWHFHSILYEKQERSGPPVCGIEGGQRREFEPFVRGGTEIMRGQFPWLAPYFKTEFGQLKFVCGGTLISSRTVITAAHCLTYRNTIAAHELVVYLGRHNLRNFTEGYVIREVETTLIHPEFDRVSFYPDADIAMLILRSRVSFSLYVQPICLWSEPTDVSRIVGEQGVVVGWGADGSGRPYSHLPNMVNNKIVSELACRLSGEVFRLLTSSRTICAGNRNGTGPCTGDSGSGFMIKREGAWMLRGIVSAGLNKNGECDANEFVVYCDVAKHKQWVLDFKH